MVGGVAREHGDDERDVVVICDPNAQVLWSRTFKYIVHGKKNYCSIGLSRSPKTKIDFS